MSEKVDTECLCEIQHAGMHHSSLLGVEWKVLQSYINNEKGCKLFEGTKVALIHKYNCDEPTANYTHIQYFSK